MSLHLSIMRVKMSKFISPFFEVCREKNQNAMTAQQHIPEGYKQTEVGVIPEEWRFKH